MSLQYSAALRNAQLDAIETTIGTTPKLRIYSGAVPANCAASIGASAVLLEEDLPSDWMGAASAGAKAKMMAELNKPWSNPDLVALNQGIFDGAIDAATGRATDGMVKSRPRYSGSFC